MALVTLAGATGSPGVTTSALGLALAWPSDVLLVDADRDPAQALQAGWLREVDTAGRGLSALARAHREHRNITEELWLQTVELPGDGQSARRFLPGFTHPGAAHLFDPVWPALADGLRALGETGCDVVVDAGRIGRDGLPAALVAASDVLLVVTRSSLRSLASLRLHLPTVQAQLEALGAGPRLGLLLVGGGRPYGRGEIASQFGCPVTHELAWEPRQAEVFSDGGASSPALAARLVGRRPLAGGALVRSLRATASQLTDELRRRDEQVRVPTAVGP